MPVGCSVKVVEVLQVLVVVVQHLLHLRQQLVRLLLLRHVQDMLLLKLIFQAAHLLNERLPLFLDFVKLFPQMFKLSNSGPATRVQNK